MTNQQTGTVLLAFGIAVMLGAAIYVLLVFMGSLDPVGVFNIKAPTLNTSDLIPGLPRSTGMDLEFIPTEALNKSLNLGATFFLMSFILNLGFKLSSLGIQLSKKEKQDKFTQQTPQNT